MNVGTYSDDIMSTVLPLFNNLHPLLCADMIKDYIKDLKGSARTRMPDKENKPTKFHASAKAEAITANVPTGGAELAIRVKDFCQRIGIGLSTFWEYKKAGKIQTIKIGRRVLIPAKEVDRILKEGLR